MPSRSMILTVGMPILFWALTSCTGPVPAPTQAPTITNTPISVPPAQSTVLATRVIPAQTTSTLAPISPTRIAATPTMTPTTAFTATIKGTANVRSGPGTNYALLGSLASGLTVRVTGRTADKAWWQIDFAPSPTGNAWVLAANTSTESDTRVDALPVVSVSSAPTRAPASPSPQQTATAITGATSILRADKDQLKPGECTTLRWNYANAKELYLNNGSEEVPVSASEARNICLDSTTTYTLRAVNANGTTQKYAFTVTVSEDCAGQQMNITRFDVSATQIKAGQTATIRWDVTCAQAVFFKEAQSAEPRQQMMRHDSVDVSPDKTTVYRIFFIGLDGGETRRDVQIEVQP